MKHINATLFGSEKGDNFSFSSYIFNLLQTFIFYCLDIVLVINNIEKCIYFEKKIIYLLIKSHYLDPK